MGEAPGAPRGGPRAGRVAVTGIGIVCSLGRGAREVWSALVEGRRGFGPVTLFDPEGSSSAPVAAVPDPGATDPAPRARRARSARDGTGGGPPGDGAGQGGLRGDRAFQRGIREGRAVRLLALAADEAVASAGLPAGHLLGEFGVAIGGANGGMPEAEEWYAGRAGSGSAAAPAAGRAGAVRARHPRSASAILRLPVSCSTDALAARFGARGPRITSNTACSSSAASIAVAADIVRSGEAPGMIAGGGDPLCRLTYSGFASLRLMDPAGCRPFDGDRKGLTLGEGAAVLIVEDMERALSRGARPLAEILHHGASCDAHHMTACHPEGRGMASAIREAIGRSGIAARDVGYVNAHGTATTVNDAAEGRAISAIFGGRSGPPVGSTKSMHGHLLGGCGAVEAAISILALIHGTIPPGAGLGDPDPAIEVNLAGADARPAPIRYAISNSFGFGGGNVVLLFAAAKEFL